MSTDDPPEKTTPPDPRNKLGKNTPNGSMEASAAKIEIAAQEALKAAMENGAYLGEAITWLALNLAKTTIQLDPS